MPSKKTSATKRSAIPRKSDYGKLFAKDWERLTHSGRYNMNRLKEAMLMLISGEALGAEWSDHELKGSWSGYRECHIGGDFLLIYQLHDNTILFVRTGTHAELFQG